MAMFFRSLLYKIIFGKEGTIMLAMLWAQKIIYAETEEAARALYNRVPRLLKPQVDEILRECGGFEWLIGE